MTQPNSPDASYAPGASQAPDASDLPNVPHSPNPPTESGPDLDPRLDRAIAEVRSAAAAPEALDAAAKRAWTHVAAALTAAQTTAQTTATIQGCADYQALIPAYLAGGLSSAQALLLDNHTRECVACRKALWRARQTAPAAARAATAARRPAAFTPRRLATAVAAALILGLGLAGVNGWLPWLGGPVAHAETVEGALYRVGDVDGRPIAAGTALRAGEAVRTARGARAVLRLADGAQVEMRERSDLAIRTTWRDTAIQVGRGDIIVRTADQGKGRLSVTTEDCQVSVNDSIFALNHGLKGSRVAVLEGKARFSQGQNISDLLPGEQASTGPEIVPVPIEDQVAWSHDAAAYRQLLVELRALRTELAGLPRPGLRHDTRLLDRAPADMVAYISLPNLSTTLEAGRTKLRERIAASPLLRQWWAQSMGGAHDRMLTDLSEHLAGARFLGDEVALVFLMAANGVPDAPLLLSTVKDEPALRRAIADEAQRLPATAGVTLEVVDDLAKLPVTVAPPASAAAQGTDLVRTTDSPPDRLFVWIKDGYFAASPNPAALREAVAAASDSAARSMPAPAADLRQQIAMAYAEGVDWLVAADLQRLVATLPQVANAQAGSRPDAPPLDGHDAGSVRASLDALGLTHTRYLIVRLEDAGTQVHQKAELVFDGPRQGMAAWLAEPSAMGALDYLSPDTHFAAAFVVKSPASFLGEFQDLVLGRVAAEDRNRVRQAMDEAGIAEFAAAMGGEVAVALDGPVLPQPSWKLIAEIYDPARFQQAMVRLVARLNSTWRVEADAAHGPAGAAAAPAAGFTLAESTLQGRKTYTLSGADASVAVVYLYDNGYLIAAPSRALLDAALRYRTAGTTLETAPRFRALLPADSQLNVSALVFQDLGPVTGPLGQLMARFGAGPAAAGVPVPSTGQGEVTRSDGTGGSAASAAPDPALLGDAMPASLAYAYARPDRIEMAGSSDQIGLGIGLMPLFGGFMAPAPDSAAR